MNGNQEVLRLRARLDRIENHLGLRSREFREGPPFYGLTVTSGLHILKDGWSQVASMAEQCSWLCDELDLALQATRDMAPVRTEQQGFQLQDRLMRARPNNGSERQLEWDIHNIWGLGNGGIVPMQPFWSRLVGFQIPLFNNRLRNGWAHIDLAGFQVDGSPVVIELKTAESKEMPLRPLLEAAAYAVALKVNWATVYQELQLLHDIDQAILANVQPLPKVFHVTVLAPPEYWDRIRNIGEITPEIWQYFRNLVEAFGQRSLPVSFAQIQGNDVAGVPDFPL